MNNQFKPQKLPNVQLETAGDIIYLTLATQHQHRESLLLPISQTVTVDNIFSKGVTVDIQHSHEKCLPPAAADDVGLNPFNAAAGLKDAGMCLQTVYLSVL